MYTTEGLLLITVVLLVVLVVMVLVVEAWVGAGVGAGVLPKNPRMLDDDDDGLLLLLLVWAVAVAVVALRAMTTLKKCVGTWMSRGKVPRALGWVGGGVGRGKEREGVWSVERNRG